MVNPAQMIALGDAQLAARDWDLKIFGVMRLSYISVTKRMEWVGYKAEQKALARRHFRRHNIGFCDGHVENGKPEKFFDAQKDEVLRLWNRDNQSHRESPHVPY